MLQPKRTKHRKAQKGRMKGNAKRGTTIAFGSFGLESIGTYLDNQPPDRSCPSGNDPSMKREGNVWIRIFPDKPITANR